MPSPQLTLASPSPQPSPQLTFCTLPPLPQPFARLAASPPPPPLPAPPPAAPAPLPARWAVMAARGSAPRPRARQRTCGRRSHPPSYTAQHGRVTSPSLHGLRGKHRNLSKCSLMTKRKQKTMVKGDSVQDTVPPNRISAAVSKLTADEDRHCLHSRRRRSDRP